MRLTDFIYAISIMGVTAHDASKCLKNGLPNSDCCALKDEAACGSDFRLRWSDKKCLDGAQSYFCEDPLGQDWPMEIEQLHDESKCEIGQNCFASKN